MSFRLKILIQSSSSFLLILVHMYDTIGVPTTSLPYISITFPTPPSNGTVVFGSPAAVIATVLALSACAWAGMACWNGMLDDFLLPAAYEEPSRVKSQSLHIFFYLGENENEMKWRKLLEDIKLNILVDTVVASRRPRFFRFFSSFLFDFNLP